MQAGKRVGITAHSHAVIGNLLEAVAKRGTEVRVLQKAEGSPALLATASSSATNSPGEVEAAVSTSST